MKKKGEYTIIVFLILLVVALFIFMNSSNTLSIFNPVSGYDAVDSDISSTSLTDNEDSVVVSVDWIPKKIEGDYTGYAFVEIYKNNELYLVESNLVKDGFKVKRNYEISGILNGKTNIKVKVGLSPLDEGSTTTSLKGCPERDYITMYATNSQDWIIDHASCKLFDDKEAYSIRFHNGKTVNWIEFDKLISGTSSNINYISGLKVHSWNYNVYKGVDSPSCNFRFIICWDWVINFFK